MLVKGKDLNRDNVADHTDLELHTFEYALRGTSENEEYLLYRLVKNEQNRRNAIYQLNEKFRKNAEFLLESLGEKHDEDLLFSQTKE